MWAFGRKLIGSAAALALASAWSPSPANAAPVPTPSTLVSVCSGVSLPPSVVTGIMGPVVTGIYTPIETNTNQTLGVLSGPLLGLPGLPAPLSVNVSGLLATAASGSDIALSVVAQDGTLVGPSGQCDATADSFTLDNPAGISIGGNQVTGLGDPGQQATAGEIDSVAIGNHASTDSTAAKSIAIGSDASVGPNATGSIAIGSNAGATGINSVALGAGSVASRDNSVSVGNRQITNVAAGTQLTDAVNLSQLNAVQAAIPANPVQYDDASHGVVTLSGAGGTLITNVKAGAVTATSTDAVNGSQLFGLQTQVNGIQTQVTSNTNAITTLQGQVGGNSSAITTLQTNVANNTTAIINLQNGGTGPVQYSNAGTPTVPNGGTPSGDLTLVGGTPGPVRLHNVGNGVVASGSTDAINGGQLFTAIASLPSFANVVAYDDSSHTSVTLNSGGPSTIVHNVAPGVAPTDAVNVSQLTNQMNNVMTLANAYTDTRFAAVDFDLRKARSEARSGTAAALAAAGMPQAMTEGRTMIAGGFGTYRGKVGFAVGASYRATDGKSVYRLGVSYDSSDHVGANVGAGFEF